jgi:prepilin-type processing-associated H-X9-DG protein
MNAGHHSSPRRAKPRPGPAFTLMELLITMTIIAALVTLAVPATQRIMGRSRAAHCLNNLSNLGSGLQLFLTDHNNTMPTLVTARDSKDSDEPAIDNTLNDYLSDTQVFHCTADRKHLFETTGSSYLWNNLLNGQNVASMDFMGFIRNGSQIPVMSDKEDFHQYQDVKVNILYADGHVAKDIQFTTNAK